MFRNRRRKLDWDENPEKSLFAASVGGMAMSAIRALTIDEFERVVGGEAPHGAGTVTDDYASTCNKLVGFTSATPVFWPTPCPWLWW
jgi:hypothetical protein